MLVFSIEAIGRWGRSFYITLGDGFGEIVGEISLTPSERLCDFPDWLYEDIDRYKLVIEIKEK